MRQNVLLFRPVQHFQIVSQLNDLCIDVYKPDANYDAAMHVVMHPKLSPPQSRQLWYEDQHGYIRSKLNNMVLDASGELTRLTQ